MIQTSQAHADDQHHGELKRSNQVAKILFAIQRRKQAACTFHNHTVGQTCQREIALPNPFQGNATARLLRGEVWRNRRLETIRIDEVDVRANAGSVDERGNILVGAIGGIGPATGCHRFHADGAQTGKGERAQQGGSNQRFAHTGIGSGDKKAAAGDSRRIAGQSGGLSAT